MSTPAPACNCKVCVYPSGDRTYFTVCDTCGNKRCPHATWHENACTGSNAPGQPGSSYGPSEHYPEPLREIYKAIDALYSDDDVDTLIASVKRREGLK